jgi:hypothetical protein
MMGKADFVNAFENELSVFNDPARATKCTCAGVTRCIASIHHWTGGVTAADMVAVMTKARERGFKATFITERVMPDHYSALPKFWPAEIAGACMQCCWV